VQGFEFRGLGLRVPGSGFMISGFRGVALETASRKNPLGVRVQDLLSFGFRVSGFGFRGSGSGFRGLGFGFGVSGSGFRVRGFGLRVSGSGFRVWGTGLYAVSERTHCYLSYQRFHFCFETFHSRPLSRWAALFREAKGIPFARRNPTARERWSTIFTCGVAKMCTGVPRS